MILELEDARNLAHGTYADVIIVEYRKGSGSPSGTAASAVSEAPHVVLEFPEGTRVIDKAQRFEIDGAISERPPKVGGAYRVIIGPSAQTRTNDPTTAASLRYESMIR